MRGGAEKSPLRSIWNFHQSFPFMFVSARILVYFVYLAKHSRETSPLEVTVAETYLLRRNSFLMNVESMFSGSRKMKARNVFSSLFTSDRYSSKLQSLSHRRFSQTHCKRLKKLVGRSRFIGSFLQTRSQHGKIIV